MMEIPECFSWYSTFNKLPWDYEIIHWGVVLNRKDGETLALAELEDPFWDTAKPHRAGKQTISLNLHSHLLQDKKIWIQPCGWTLYFHLETLCHGTVMSLKNPKHTEENPRWLQVLQAFPAWSLWAKSAGSWIGEVHGWFCERITPHQQNFFFRHHLRWLSVYMEAIICFFVILF